MWVIVFKCNLNHILYVENNLSKTALERLLMGFTKNPFKALMWSVKNKNYPEIISVPFNIIGLIPVGAVLGIFYKKPKACLLSFALATGIEIFQLLSCLGGFEPLDIVLNALGAVIGVFLLDLILPCINPRLVNKITYILIYIGITFDIFCIINTAINFPL
jgi:glycopeptide antibiotics resistance protein